MKVKYNEDDRIAQSMGYLDFDHHMQCLYEEEMYEKAYREQEEKEYWAEQERLHWEEEEKDYEKHLRAVFGNTFCDELSKIVPKLSNVCYGEDDDKPLPSDCILCGLIFNVPIKYRRVEELKFEQYYIKINGYVLHWVERWD